MKNEMYLTDMAQIMESFNQYVPSEISSQHVIVNGKDYEYDDSKLIQLLLFGDQLTVAKAHSAAVLREPQKNEVGQAGRACSLSSQLAYKDVSSAGMYY